MNRMSAWSEKSCLACESCHCFSKTEKAEPEFGVPLNNKGNSSEFSSFFVQKKRSFALWKPADFHPFFTFVAALNFTRNCTIIMSSISDSSEEKIVSPGRIADGNYDASKLSRSEER